MNEILLVPNSIRDEINRRLDAAFEIHPDAMPQREEFYSLLLKSFDELGFIPNFSLERDEQ